ncbi:MAG TPA: Fic family protein [Chitinophagaceae bacterium]|nr:Fic family protein [Chitinophagaceae bacterium]
MKPPYNLTSEILKLVSEVSHKIGEVNASFLTKQSPELRKRNRIRTIQASLAVEGNTLSIDQVTAIIENKRILGPAKDIKEVSNAIEVYKQLNKFNPFNEKTFLSAHKVLMQGLIKNAGQYRNSGVGIVKGSQITHLAPPAGNVSLLMKDLFNYLKKSNELTLIKSCVFHYEMEFIHPFSDGNGRMGRLWQTLLLMQQYSVFEFLPFETLINKNQKKYYQVLSKCDKQGESTIFIEFMLTILSDSLDELLAGRSGPISSSDRIRIFLSSGIKEFTRKNYMNYFKTISSATASRDILLAVKENLVKKSGDKNKTIYKVK